MGITVFPKKKGVPSAAMGCRVAQVARVVGLVAAEGLLTLVALLWLAWDALVLPICKRLCNYKHNLSTSRGWHAHTLLNESPTALA